MDNKMYATHATQIAGIHYISLTYWWRREHTGSTNEMSSK